MALILNEPEPPLSRLAPLLSRGNDLWRTPPEVFEPLHREFHFEWDMAASQEDHLTTRWYGPGGEYHDAISASWPEGPKWINPPYSRALDFVSRASQDHIHRLGPIVLLLPARTDTRWFHNYLWDRVMHRPRTRVEVRLLKGRIRFLDQNNQRQNPAPFPSMVVVLR